MGGPATITPGMQSIVVRIEDVDMTNRLVHAFDKSKARIQISFRDIPGGGLLRIPDQGERWVAERQGWVWRLTGRLSSAAEQAEVAGLLEAGDSRLYSPGILYIDADEVIVNGRPFGTHVHDLFHETSTFTSVTLSGDVANPLSVMPFLNGLFIDPSQWTLTNRTIAFAATMAAGTLVVYYETIAQAYDDPGLVKGVARISGAETYTP